ncbi:hypothetical protein [Gimesia sp.]|uniref:hypothetical protein n=1 Tax=Gimesia sp. TaxID=2024833 RepID=UPI003A9252D7
MGSPWYETGTTAFRTDPTSTTRSDLLDRRKDRKNWEDHLLYLDALKQLVTELDHNIPLAIIGDYNQRLPRSR